MAGTRIPLHVTEKQTSLGSGEDNMIMSLKYDMSSAGRMIPGANDATLVSGYPIAIYSYEFHCLGNFYGQIYQTYGDSDDDSSLSNWNVSDDEFILALKQWRQIAGTGTSLDKTVIRYRAKKNPKRLQARFGKWKRPPIYLGPGAGNKMYWMVHNNSDSTDRTALAHVTITSWKQFT